MASAPNPYVPPPVMKRRSFFGPIALIGVGVVFLLVNMGKLSMRDVFIGFAKYWPLLIIMWGLVKLYEHAMAKREGLPAPGIGPGGVFLLVFLVLFGLTASGINRAKDRIDWNRVGAEMDDDEFASIFVGGEKHTFDDTIEREFPANASLKIVNERGDIRVSPSTDGKLRIVMKKTIHAENQAAAAKINTEAAPAITVVDNVVNVDATYRGEWRSGSINMDVFVPAKAMADLMTMRGDVYVMGREANVKMHSGRGDLRAEDIKGDVDAHIRGSGDFIAKRVTGNVALEGTASDTTIADIGGTVSLQGTYYGDLAASKIAKTVTFRSSRTDLSFTKLDGDLSIASGEIRSNDVVGPVRIVTTSAKDIHLDNTSGDVKIENVRGTIELHPKTPFGNIEASTKGSITVRLPETGNFTVDARANRGEIESDFPVNTKTEGRNARATGNVGKGGAKVSLESQNGVITIRKG